jgi:hypothetical protein
LQRMGAPLETKFREEIAAPGVAFEANGEHSGDAAVRGAMKQMLHQAATDASCRSAASATATATAARDAQHRTAHPAQAAEHGYLRGGFVAVAVLPKSAARGRTSAREEHLEVCEGRPCNNGSGFACGDNHRATRDVSAAKPLVDGENKAPARLLRHSPASALQCSAAACQPSRLQLRRSRCRCCGTGA